MSTTQTSTNGRANPLTSPERGKREAKKRAKLHPETKNGPTVTIGRSPPLPADVVKLQAQQDPHAVKLLDLGLKPEVLEKLKGQEFATVGDLLDFEGMEGKSLLECLPKPTGLSMFEVAVVIDAVVKVLNAGGIRRCRQCGCTDDRACEGGCSWVEADLCSSCKDDEAFEVEGEAEEAIVAGKGERLT